MKVAALAIGLIALGVTRFGYSAEAINQTAIRPSGPNRLRGARASRKLRLHQQILAIRDCEESRIAHPLLRGPAASAKSPS